MDEIERISALFLGLGAEKKQAHRMATQILKRAEQLAEENRTTKLLELQRLLEVATSGAQGSLRPEDQRDFVDESR